MLTIEQRRELSKMNHPSFVTYIGPDADEPQSRKDRIAGIGGIFVSVAIVFTVCLLLYVVMTGPRL